MLIAALPSSVLTASAEDYDSIESLTLDTEIKVTAAWGVDCSYFFTPEETGDYVFYSVGDYDTVCKVYDSYDNFLGTDDDGGADTNFAKTLTLTAGKRYRLLVTTYFPRSCTFRIGVKKSVVLTGLEIASMPIRSEYVRGHVYEALSLSGFVLKATYDDGTTELSPYRDYNWCINYEPVYLDADDLEETGSIAISCCDCELSLDLSIIDNPVESIEVLKAADCFGYENCGGYFNYDGVYIYYCDDMYDSLIKVNYTDGTSEITTAGHNLNGYDFYVGSNQEDGEPWTVGTDNKIYVSYLDKSCVLYYEIKPNPVKSLEIETPTSAVLYDHSNGFWYGDRFEYALPDISDTRVRANYVDGTSKILSWSEVYVYSEQSDKPWTVGGENLVLFSYMNKTASMPIPVLENPVCGIEIVSAPDRVYRFGDEYCIDGGFEYWFFPEDYSGLEFAAYYDGGSKTFTDKDIETRFDDIQSRDRTYVDGIEITFTLSDSYPQEPGDYGVNVNYAGAEDGYTVTLLAAEPAQFELVSLPDSTNPYSNFDTDPTGFEFNINCENGEVKHFKAEHGNFIYHNVPTNGFTLYFGEEDTGKLYYNYSEMLWYLSYNGNRFTVPELVFVYSDIKAVDGEVISFTEDAVGTELKLYFDNGTSGTVTLNDVCDENGSEDEGYYSGCAFTPYGLMNYFVVPNIIDENKTLYKVYFAGIRKLVLIEKANCGDVNGDGKIDNSDLIRLKKYLAGQSVVLGE